MKITSNVGKISKVFGNIIFTSCIIFPLVYMFLKGIEILIAEPTCMEKLCFSSTLDNPVLGWVFIGMPLIILYLIFLEVSLIGDNKSLML
ncbi:hypothetical protein C6560_17485 [Enterobacter sp. FS01]|nr:hypothetical protein C6560_17485 [Enterobacter sp. FS01]